MEMEALPFEVIAPAGQILGESATWCARTQVLWWIDIRAPQVKRWNSGTGVIDVWTMPELCGAVVPTTGTEVVVALRAGVHTLDPRSGTLSLLATLETGQPEHRLNEGKCDHQGRLWCGSMWDFGKQPTGGLYRVTPDRSRRSTGRPENDGNASGGLAEAGLGAMIVLKVRGAVTIPNGIGFSPDGRRMIFVDTATGRIETAAYDTDAGMPGPWHTLVEAGAAPGNPDGNTVDAEGCIWSTRFGAGCIARFTPLGKLDRLIRLPVSQPTSCSFGGPNLDTLFVTSATQRLMPEALAAEPLAGALLALRPGVQGLAEPPFRWNAPASDSRSFPSPFQHHRPETP
jgi:sugar lactone lactonase YvrE